MKPETSQNTPEANRVGSTGSSAFDRAQWLEAPECVKCSRPMYLNEGGEWPEDNRLLLCGDCMLTALEKALAQLDEVDEALTELGWHTDRGILQRVKQLTASSPNQRL